mgnify:CR=1 FL=1
MMTGVLYLFYDLIAFHIISLCNTVIQWYNTVMDICFGKTGIMFGAPRDIVTIYKRKEGDYYTYRVPSLVVVGNGDMLCFAEARKYSSYDHGTIGLAVKRSSDGGDTWGDIHILFEAEGITYGNPTTVYANGALHLFFCKNNKQVYYMRSMDSAAHIWIKPTDITTEIIGMSEASDWIATGPGSALYNNHRLIVPVNYDGGSATFYSDTYGQTWSVSNKINMGNECQVIRIGGDALMINCRYHTTNGSSTTLDTITSPRIITYSSDNGSTWEDVHMKWHMNTKYGRSTCHGSMISLKTGMLYIGPENKIIRAGLSVWYSVMGSRWEKILTIDNGFSAYSTITTLGDMHFIAYERGCAFDGMKPYTTDIVLYQLN